MQERAGSFLKMSRFIGCLHVQSQTEAGQGPTSGPCCALTSAKAMDGTHRWSQLPGPEENPRETHVAGVCEICCMFRLGCVAQALSLTNTTALLHRPVHLATSLSFSRHLPPSPITLTTLSLATLFSRRTRYASRLMCTALASIYSS